MSDNIHPSLLKLEVVPIASLFLDPANARKHPERNLDAIKASLIKYGQRKPIVVRRSNMTVTAGNGTLSAARSLGWQNIAAVLTDDDTTLATAYAIADNKTAELAEWDDNILGTLLAGLQDTAISAADIGFTEEEMAGLIAKLDPPAPQPKGDGYGERPMIAYAVRADQADVINLAIEQVRRAHNDKHMEDGDCLESIAHGFMSRADK